VPDSSPSFAVRGSTDEVEEGVAFAPKFDAEGLVTCVATDARSGAVLMVAHMNAQALQQTIATGEAGISAAPRRALWRKGESSGHVQRVVEMARRLRSGCGVDKSRTEGGGACHTAGARASTARCHWAGAARNARVSRSREDV
jgi:phosphoribosyl-AMP cyclohydrolase